MTNADKVKNLDNALEHLLDAELGLHDVVSNLKKALSLIDRVDRTSTVAGQLAAYTISNLNMFLLEEHSQPGNISSVIEMLEKMLREAKKELKKESE